jgi:hypothetical protein
LGDGIDGYQPLIVDDIDSQPRAVHLLYVRNIRVNNTDIAAGLGELGRHDTTQSASSDH